MGLKDDILEMKKEVSEVKEIKEHSFAMELFNEQKRVNERKDRRSFIIIMTLIILLFSETVFMFVKLGKIGKIEETIKVKDVNDINNSNFNIGK